MVAVVVLKTAPLPSHFGSEVAYTSPFIEPTPLHSLRFPHLFRFSLMTFMLLSLLWVSLRTRSSIRDHLSCLRSRLMLCRSLPMVYRLKLFDTSKQTRDLYWWYLSIVYQGLKAINLLKVRGVVICLIRVHLIPLIIRHGPSLAL